MMYQLKIDKQCKKDFKSFKRSGNEGLKKKLEKILTNPKTAGVPLHGNLKNLWKAVVMPYRIIYIIDEEQKIVTLVKIQTRDDVYVETQLPEDFPS